MKADDAKHSKELKEDNARLKRLVADPALDIDILKKVHRKISESGSPPSSR